MKFEDMKKAWSEHHHKFEIDEKKLHESIKHKKKKSSRFVSQVEWILIFANLIAGGTIVAMSFVEKSGEIYANALGLVMLAAGIYIYTRRSHRLKHENRFDRTMLGDLDHAISNATYRARLSYGILIYFLFVAVLTVSNAIYEDKSWLKIGLIIVFFAITWLLGRWEYRSWHLADKQRLEAMRKKLVEPV